LPSRRVGSVEYRLRLFGAFLGKKENKVVDPWALGT